MSSVQKEAVATSRATRAAKSIFRITRNVLAVMGVIFAYLLYTGWQQYEDRVASGDTSCTLTHCV